MWQLVTFEPDEVEGGELEQLSQFNFNLMCAEIYQQPNGQWLASLIDTDGDEMWVSHQAKYLVREHLRECFADWLNEMSKELP